MSMQRKPTHRERLIATIMARTEWPTVTIDASKEQVRTRDTLNTMTARQLRLVLLALDTAGKASR